MREQEVRNLYQINGAELSMQSRFGSDIPRAVGEPAVWDDDEVLKRYKENGGLLAEVYLVGWDDRGYPIGHKKNNGRLARSVEPIVDGFQEK